MLRHGSGFACSSVMRKRSFQDFFLGTIEGQATPLQWQCTLVGAPLQLLKASFRHNSSTEGEAFHASKWRMRKIRPPGAVNLYRNMTLYILVQATRVRFRFGPDALEVVIGEQQDSSENAFVGGENKWSYSTFTNWEFWWPNFPVLVYFKVRRG